MNGALFANRRDAGRQLARHLQSYAGRPDVVVLGLPRGGVPVAFEVAQALRAPLDVFLVRKLGVPFAPELAMGAIATGGVRILNEEVVDAYHIPAEVIEAVTRAEMSEMDRRQREYLGGRTPVDIRDRIAMLIDDGLATGSTMRAAVEACRMRRPAKVTVAVPVGAASTCAQLGRLADEVVCAATPASFSAVGTWYADFAQTTDKEVRALLQQRGVD